MRVIGHETSSITLADNAYYNLGSLPTVASQYEIEYAHSGGTFGTNVTSTQMAQLRCPARSAKPSEVVRFGERSTAGTGQTARATSRRIASVEFDADDVGFENVFVTEAVHGLKIGDWVYVAL
ncbi:MAG: hypothetical protein ACYS7Y_35230, partial [Planctomycetota bacterium]